MSHNMKTKYSVVDLFTGAGGLSCGFLQTNRFTVKAAFENNQFAQSTYKRNHKNVIIYDDVADALTDAVKADIGNVDVVIGGPPCQGFSSANRQKNQAVSLNNSLVKKFVQVVLHLNPTAFVMENVSMLQSEIHRFYVDKNDTDTIAKYGIKTAPSVIPLLDADFMFPGVSEIAADRELISKYLWDKNDYLALNVVFKYRNNPEKLLAALEKHKRKLCRLSERFLLPFDERDHILQQEHVVGNALQNYYFEGNSLSADGIAEAIMPVIMLQRMLSKAKEILDNNIVVDEYSTEHGLTAHCASMAVIDYIESVLGAPSNGYKIDKGVLSAADFGVPQKRMRFVVIGVKATKTNEIELPVGRFSEKKYRTVKDAIEDLEDIETATEVSDGDNGILLPSTGDISKLGKQLRNSKILYNHVATATTQEALKRFEAIQQGDNFHSLPPELKTTYSDTQRTQNTIYLRLKYSDPSGTVVNVRKSMWIHPVKHRALSIREAARLQTFPDRFVFCGTKDSQYQQVGNAVPPMLAKSIARHLCGYLDKENKYG